MMRMMFGVNPSRYGYHFQEIPSGDMWLNHFGGDLDGVLGPVCVPTLVRRPAGPCRSNRRTNARCHPICLPLTRTTNRVSSDEEKSGRRRESESMRSNIKGADSTKQTPMDVEASRDPWEETLKTCQDHFHRFLRAIHSQWSTSVRLPGFCPDDITVKVDDDKCLVKIHASRETADDSGFDRRKTTKNVKLPEDIIPESIKVSFHPSGILHISGKRQLDRGEDEQEDSSQMTNTTSGEETAKDAEESAMSIPEKDKNDQEITTGKGTEAHTDKEECENHVSGPTREGDVTAGSRDTAETPSSGDSKETGEMSSHAATEKKQDEEESTQPLELMATVSQENTGTLSEIGTQDLRPLLALDVSKFTPEQVSVKVSGNNVTVVAEDQQEEEGFISVHRVQRCFPLPADTDPASLTSHVDSEGVLNVLAGQNAVLALDSTQGIPIQMEIEK